MFLRRPLRPAPRTRTLAVGGALAALAVVGGGTVVAVSAPSGVTAGDIQLVQNAAAQEMELGAPVDLDLEPVVARAAGGTIPEGTSIQVTGLPDGLVQNGWVISGTPTRVGDYDVLVTVSNAGVSQSEKVAITVSDEPGTAVTTADDESGATTTTADDESGATTTTATESGSEATTAVGADDGTDDGGATTTSPSTTATTTSRTEPTLSAVPGATTAQDDGTETGTETGTGADGESGADDGTGADGESGADDGTGTGEATTPDLCAIGADGEMDGSSLANGLAPLLTGDGEQAPAGLTMVLVNAIASMLPSLLGESGSAADAGSVGQILCTLQPALSGGGEDTTAGADGADATAAVGGDGAAAGADGQTAALAGLTGAPAALLGLFGTGTGSLGG